jgi:hypothetical protein
MLVLSMFYGIIIYMYFQDDSRHHIPHIHAKYQDEEAVFSILDGTLIDGKIPPKKENLVRAWITIHEDELLANWNLAVEGNPTFKIDPLK